MSNLIFMTPYLAEDSFEENSDDDDDDSTMCPLSIFSLPIILQRTV